MIEYSKKYKEVKDTLTNIIFPSQYGCSISFLYLVLGILYPEEVINKQNENELYCLPTPILRAIVYDAVLYAFNYGYINGYRHARDNGIKPVDDMDFNRTIDFNSQVEKIEQIEIFRKLFNNEPI